MPPSESRGRRDVGCYRGLVGKVAFAGMRLDPERLDLRRGRVECRAAARADRDGGTGLRECERDRAPDAPAAAGDDGPFALETELH